VDTLNVILGQYQVFVRQENIETVQVMFTDSIVTQIWELIEASVKLLSNQIGIPLSSALRDMLLLVELLQVEIWMQLSMHKESRHT
jgi:hypothetical protein